MILLADSGTTKCDWIFVDNQRHDKHFIISTPGLNPTYATENEIIGAVNSSNDILSIKSYVEQIFFFGSGCGPENIRQKMKQTLKSLFYKSTDIHVLSDIEGAVFATTDDPAVVAILGTGSNCCYYDGKKLDVKIPSLGYSLMDDGGGNAIGRACLRAYFYRRMPEHLAKKFEERYNMDPERVKYNLYHHNNQSAYLASFAPFVLENLDDPIMQGIMEFEIRLFINNALHPYKEELKELPVHFVGSIAHHAESVIKNLCKEYGYTVGSVLGRPVKELARRIETIIEHIK